MLGWGKPETEIFKKAKWKPLNEAMVMAQLRKQGLMPSSVKERGKGLDVDIKIPGFEPKVSTKDLVVFHPPVCHHD